MFTTTGHSCSEYGCNEFFGFTYFSVIIKAWGGEYELENIIIMAISKQVYSEKLTIPLVCVWNKRAIKVAVITHLPA